MFNQTIRVFLSSTFKDMKSERDALHRGAFPELRALCESQGFQFQVIDLRWGVNEEAAWDQRTEGLCLEEIRRCQQVTPRPNFIALVGHRYGWRPLPGVLTASDWAVVHTQAGAWRRLLEDWYEPDANNVPEVRRLRRRVTAAERDGAHWTEAIEKPLRELFLRVISDSDAGRLSAPLRETELSLTEKEIRLGAESAAENSWQAYAYFRDLADGQRRDDLGEPWVDLDAAGRPADPRAEAKLRDLRRRLEAPNSVTTRRYVARLQGAEVDTAALEELNRLVLDDLRVSIQRQIDEYRRRDPLQVEIESHAAFGQQRLRNYVPRPREEERALEYLRGPGLRPLVLHGASGAGKTAILAAVHTAVVQRFSERVCLTRFVGATGDSTALRSLVRSLHAEAAVATGAPDGSTAMLNDPPVSFRQALSLASATRPLVVLVDALDQLSSEDRALTGNWIPRELPPHCHLIVTCMTGRDEVGQEGSGIFPALIGRLDAESIQAIDEPDAAELQAMFAGWMGDLGRTVTAPQRETVHRKLAGCPRPLYLRVLVEIARSWSAADPADDLPDTIPGIIERFLAVAENPGRHGRAIVEAVLGLLAASRSGLTEVEMIELLDGDEEVLDQFRSTSRYEYPDLRTRLPPAVWSRLFFDLGFLLGDATAAGASVQTFYHRQLGFVARQRYLTANPRRHHRRLAAFFELSPVWYTAAGRTPNRRRAHELTHQLRRVGDSDAVDRLQRLLTSEDAVEAKITADLGQDLLLDYFEMENVAEARLEDLVAFFAEQYLRDGSPLAVRFGPPDLHSQLGYRGGSVFYRGLLQALGDATQEGATDRGRRLRSRARVDLGGMLRRRMEFDKASALLEVAEAAQNGLTPGDLGTAWYEIGYLHFVRDEVGAAARAMLRSVELAEAGQDPVGAAISRILANWSRYLDRPGEAALRTIVADTQNALVLFLERQNSDPRAFRWVMNALAHLINAAFLLGDAPLAEEYLREFRANPWIREFESPVALLQYEARCAMLRKRFAEAVSIWETYLEARPSTNTTEAGAWPLLDYGMALSALGRRSQAVRLFRRGLRLNSRGVNNAHWQWRIRREQAKQKLGARLYNMARRLVRES